MERSTSSSRPSGRADANSEPWSMAIDSHRKRHTQVHRPGAVQGRAFGQPGRHVRIAGYLPIRFGREIAGRDGVHGDLVGPQFGGQGADHSGQSALRRRADRVSRPRDVTGDGDTWMIRPPPRARICGATARDRVKAPTRFTSTSLRKAAASSPPKGRRSRAPAALTRMSKPPSASRSSMAALVMASSVMSKGKAGQEEHVGHGPPPSVIIRRQQPHRAAGHGAKQGGRQSADRAL